HSPIDGRAGARLVDPGNVVSTSGGNNGGTNMLTIQKIDPIYVDFTVTESDLMLVRKHMGEGTLKVLADLPQDKAALAATAAAGAAGATSQPAAATTQQA